MVKRRLVLVDCVPMVDDHPWQGSSAWPLAVIDHHEPNGHPFRSAFRDVRPQCAATASIAASYLREQGIEPDADLATALLFAIRTESIPEARLTRADRVIGWLNDRVTTSWRDRSARTPVRIFPTSCPLSRVCAYTTTLPSASCRGHRERKSSARWPISSYDVTASTEFFAVRR
jgi:hypothetical protein